MPASDDIQTANPAGPTTQELFAALFPPGGARATVDELTEALRRNPADGIAALRLAQALEAGGKKKDAQHINRYAAQFLLGNRYDAYAAVSVHPDKFAERHLIATWMAENIDRIRADATSRMKRKWPSKKAFVYWNGKDMPPLVAACRASLRRHLPRRMTLVELDDTSWPKLVTVPAEIHEMFAGNPTAFSDILRLYILTEIGGTWFDATLFATPGLPAFLDGLKGKSLFLFTYAGSRTGSWFIKGQPTDYGLQMVRSALILWLTEYRRWTNYFQFHDVVEMLYWVDDRYRQQWDEMDKIHPRNALKLLGNLTKPVSDETFRADLEGSPLHKLSWKYDQSQAGETSVAARLLAMG